MTTKAPVVVRRLSRDGNGMDTTDATGCFDIEIGEGGYKIAISVTDDGFVRLNARDGALVSMPVGSNCMLFKSTGPRRTLKIGDQD